MAFNIEMNARNMDLNESQKDVFTRKIEKLERFLSEIDN